MKTEKETFLDFLHNKYPKVWKRLLPSERLLILDAFTEYTTGTPLIKTYESR